jgi:glycosyltransferase involved in cell wall biosynthesis
VFPRWSSRWPALKEFQISWPLLDWLKKNLGRYDIVHTHVLFSFVPSIGMYLARKSRIPYINRPAGLLCRWSRLQRRAKKLFFWHLFEQANFKGAAAIHYTSELEEEESTEWVGGSVPKFQAPLGCQPFPESTGEIPAWRVQIGCPWPRPLLLFLGRIHPKKGLDLLFEALAQLSWKDWNLVVAGEGEAEYCQTLKSRAKDWGISDRITWQPFAAGQTKSSLYEAADFFVLTSHSENFGLTVTESLCCGTPTIITRGVALAGEVERRHLGIVCDLKLEAIVQALDQAQTELVSWRARRAEIRGIARETWNWTRCAREVARQYQLCLDASRP